MPNLKTHMGESKRRTGYTFISLHKWMDEGIHYLKKNHRRERHDLDYLKYVKKKWGKLGQIEFLEHIILDYKNTLKKIKK